MESKKKGISSSGEYIATDYFIATGRIGRRELSAGCYSFAEVQTLVCEELVKQGKDKEALEELRAKKITVRKYFYREFGIVTGPRQAWHDPHFTADRADLRSFKFNLGVAQRKARRESAEERKLRKRKISQAWRTTRSMKII